jgi:TrwC relaxase
MRTTGNGFFFIAPVRVRVEVISYTCRLLILKSVASSCTVKISIAVTLVTSRTLNLYEITTGRSGAPEIKGYTQEYLDASSPRSQQIHEYLERTGRSGKEAAEIAAHSTRDRKEIYSPGEIMTAHRKLAADFGHQAETVVRAARERSQHHEKPVHSFERVRGLSPFPATRTSSARRLWMNVR